MEPSVIINGHQLTQAQVLTLRAAVMSFSLELAQNILGEDEHGSAMKELYRQRIAEINKLFRS